MNAQPSLFETPSPDFCARKSHFHENSVKAHERVQDYKATQIDRIRIFIAACGFWGATFAEVAAALDHPTKQRKYFPNEISGRRRKMLNDGLVFESGRQRDGGEVLVSKKEWVNT